MKKLTQLSILIVLLISACSQESVKKDVNSLGANEQIPGEYRFERVYGETPDGFPLPLTGKPITKNTSSRKKSKC